MEGAFPAPLNIEPDGESVSLPEPERCTMSRRKGRAHAAARLAGPMIRSRMSESSGRGLSTCPAYPRAWAATSAAASPHTRPCPQSGARWASMPGPASPDSPGDGARHHRLPRKCQLEGPRVGFSLSVLRVCLIHPPRPSGPVCLRWLQVICSGAHRVPA